jgi:hypothetical protein
MGAVATAVSALWPGPVGLVFDVPPARRAQAIEKLGIAESEIYSGGSITQSYATGAVAASLGA